jgi:glycosyltransferase involved in cell wall biosynthesis
MMRFRRAFSNLPDAVSGNSSFILKKHIECGLFQNSRKYVIYNSLDKDNIRPNTSKAARLDFGYMGQLSYHKGIEFILNVFYKNEKQVNLNVFGRGITPQYEDHLKDKFKSDNIKFHGFIDSEKAFMSIDVLIVPSLCLDSLPRVIYEAYSYGIPVITSDRGGGPEIVEEGKTGFVYSADSEKELLEKIRLFKDNPQIITGMRKNCLIKAEDFLPERAISKYVELYNDITK